MIQKLAFSLYSSLSLKDRKQIIDIYENLNELFDNINHDRNLASRIFGRKNIKKALRDAETELEFIRKNGIGMIWYQDETYPRLLKECPDAPLVLFAKGNCNLNRDKVLSIVGSRSCTRRGTACCERLVDEIKEHGHSPLIVSGLAYGIDIAAHRSALKNGLDTVAVLGQSFFRPIYPAEHEADARRIIDRGGMILSEYDTGIPGNGSLFVQRNRIIAGLSHGTVIVESALKGGSMTTAKFAFSYSREVMCFPGRCEDIMSQGCLSLIKTDRARLIEDVDDLEWAMGWDCHKEASPEVTISTEGLSDEQLRILDIVLNSERPVGISEISSLTGLSTTDIMSNSIFLELRNLIISLPGNRFYKS